MRHSDGREGDMRENISSQGVDHAGKEVIFQRCHTCLALALASLEYMLAICSEQEEKNKLEQLRCSIKGLLELSSQFMEGIGATNFNQELLRGARGRFSRKKVPGRRRQKLEEDQEFIKQLNQVMEQNFSDLDFNVKGLAQKLHLSEATLYRKIHTLTDETPCKFIRSFRLQRAVQLLENHFGTVMDVAFEVGFSSPSYFTKCFREEFRRLPSAFEASPGLQPVD